MSIQNGSIEGVNGCLRDALLNETLLGSIAYFRAVLETCQYDYYTEGPHSTLGWLTPIAFASAFRLRGDLALGYAKSSTPDHDARPPQTPNQNSQNELTAD